MTAVVAASVLAGAAVAGPLDPPAGPPTSTMKRIDQIEPRRCLNDMRGSEQAVVVISEPGSYYLSGDIMCPGGKSAIVISTTGDVSIDLNGFALRGNPGAIAGIVVAHTAGGGGSGGSINIGSITGGGGAGKASLRGATGGGGGRIALFETGIDASSSLSDLHVSGVTVTSCTQGVSYSRGGGGAGKATFKEFTVTKCTASAMRLHSGGGGGTTGGGRLSVDMDHVSISSCGSGPLGSTCPISCNAGRISISSSSFTDVSGTGLSITQLSSSPPGGSSLEVKLSDVLVSSVTGTGISVTGVQGSSSLEIRCQKIEMSRCAGPGLSLTHVGDADCDGLDAISCGGAGLQITGGGHVTVLKSRTCQCPAGMHVSDMKSFSVADSSVCDISGGDGISVSNCPVVSFARSSVQNVDAGPLGGIAGRGVALMGHGKATFKEFTVTKCASNGISHFPSSSSSVSLQHDDVQISECGGVGMSVSLSGSPPACENFMNKFRTLLCTGGGLVIDGSALTASSTGLSPSCTVTLADSSMRSSSSGSGGTLLCGTTSHFFVTLDGVTCSDNAGDGFSVVSSSSPGTPVQGRTTMTDCVMSNNGATGVMADNPLHKTRCVISDNGGDGVRCVSADPFVLAGSMTECVVSRNAGVSVSCSRGRYASMSSQITDGGSDGMVIGLGCLLLTDTQVHHCAGNGVVVTGTFNMQGGALRRNGLSGGKFTNSSVTVKSGSIEFNGMTTASPGLHVLNGGSIVFSDSSFVSNNGDGLSISGSSSSSPSSCSVTGCTFSSNSLMGMRAQQYVGASFDACVVQNNGGTGMHFDSSSSRNRVSSCVFSGPSVAVVLDGSSNFVVRNQFQRSTGSVVTPVVSSGQGNVIGAVVEGAASTQGCVGNENIVY